MAWTYLALIVSALVVTGLHLRRRSRHGWLAAVSLALAVFAFLSGFSIGVFVAPLAVIVLVAASLVVPRVPGGR